MTDTRLHAALDAAQFYVGSRSSTAAARADEERAAVAAVTAQRTSVVRRAGDAIAHADALAARRVRPFTLGDELPRDAPRLHETFAAPRSEAEAATVAAREARWCGEVSAATASMRALGSAPRLSGNARGSADRFAYAAAGAAQRGTRKRDSVRHVVTAFGRRTRAAKGATDEPDYCSSETTEMQLVANRRFWRYLEYVSAVTPVGRPINNRPE